MALLPTYIRAWTEALFGVTVEPTEAKKSHRARGAGRTSPHIWQRRHKKENHRKGGKRWKSHMSWWLTHQWSYDTENAQKEKGKLMGLGSQNYRCGGQRCALIVVSLWYMDISSCVAQKSEVPKHVILRRACWGRREMSTLHLNTDTLKTKILIPFIFNI